MAHRTQRAVNPSSSPRQSPPSSAPVERRVASRITTRRPRGKAPSDELWRKICASATKATATTALLQGDVVSRLQELPSGSVNTCLTSPPYWGARDYEVEGQIGREAECGQYVDRLVAVFDEVYRVLREDGTAWLNLGDVYFNHSPTENGRPPRRGWKRQKQLTLVPFRVALALQDAGWWVRNVVVWQKPNAMPLSAQDRLASTWEPVFLLARSPRYYFNLDPIRVPHVTDDGVERERAARGKNNGKAHGKPHLREWLTSPRHRATIEGVKDVLVRPEAPEPVELASYLRAALARSGLSINAVAAQLNQPFERVRHYFRTDAIGSRLPPVDAWRRLKSILRLGSEYDARMEVVVQDNVFRHHPAGRNPGDFVSVALRGSDESHFAVMPTPLAEWCLRATLPAGGVCLDPFMGTGTTGVASLKLGGRFVGIDIDAAALRACERRLRKVTIDR